MEIERPHRTTSTPTTTSELFICFTSRLSHSSSMRLSSKSILSPGRNATADKSTTASLTTSLSRRLRHNGSLRGAQSPSPAMFPNTTNKKSRGSSAFAENPEPSSPKVTCIGQVRVKTKKQGKKMKMRACRSKRINGGESSFRVAEQQQHRVSNNNVNSNLNNSNNDININTSVSNSQHHHQRWVHLPLTICEALKTFGNEFSCLLPCKSSCFSNNHDERGGEKGVEERENHGGCNGGGGGGSSCGAVFRWLVSLQDGEEGKRRDIELVVSDEVEVERERGRVIERECSRRRSIFDDMEFDDLFQNVANDNNETSRNNVGDCSKNNDEIDDEKGRVSVCIPPKNALLLMRCRSDPVKMASISHKLWEAPAPVVNDEDGDGEEEEEVVEEKVVKVEGNEVDHAQFVERLGVEEFNHAQFVEKLDVEDGELAQFDEKLDDVGENEGIREEIIEVRDEKEEIVNVDANVDANVEDLGVCDEKFDEIVDECEVEKIEGELDEEVRVEEIEEKQGVENREKETEEKQSIENCETSSDVEVFHNVEETLLMEDENLVIGLVNETFTVEEQVVDCEKEQSLGVNERVLDEKELNLDVNELVLSEKEQTLDVNEQVLSEKEQTLVKMIEDEDIEVQEESQREESSELSTNSSDSCTSSEESTAESKDLELKLGKEDEEVLIQDQSEARKSMEKDKNNNNNKPMLPDCLLLMMCEPKLSMEVSKETWVCSTDFVRWLPDRQQGKKGNKIDGVDESNKKTKAAAVAALPPLHQQPPQVVQPGRSSISFPAVGGVSVANMIEKKLANAGVGCEPFVLTRCKSAPQRSTAKFVPPELACSLWGRENGRKLEPHRPATCGATGVGF